MHPTTSGNIRKCVEQLNQRDYTLGNLVSSGTSQNCETLVKAQVEPMQMPHEEFIGEIETVELVSAGNSIKTTISLLGRFLEHFVTECQKPSLNIQSIQNFQLPMGHPFKALLAHCSSDAMRSVLVRVLSHHDLVSLIGTREPSLLIEVFPSRRDFFNAIMIRAISVSEKTISHGTGGLFFHYLFLLMRASISKQATYRPADVSIN